MTVRGWAVLVFVLLGVGLVVAAALLVPWTRPPARADQLAALAELPPEQVRQGRALRAALRLPGYGSLLLGLVVAVGLGFTPVGAWLVDYIARPFGGHWLAAAGLGGLVVVLAGQIATLPLGAWRHTILTSHGLSTQSWGGWLADRGKAYLVTAVVVAVALSAFFGATQLLPRWWWAVGAAGAAGLVVLLSFLFPLLVEPLFNRFTSMEPGPLRTELLALAARDGVPVDDVLVADASRRTRGVNAYVSGLGPSRRIVIYDTLLREAPPAEVTAVVAHELAHAKHRDVVTGTLLGAGGAAAAVVGLYLLGGWGGLLRVAGVSSVAEPRAVALLAAVVALVSLVASPVQALVSRQVEARADAHAVALTGDADTFVAMQMRLSATNLSDPDPPAWERLLFASHPSTVERIASARSVNGGRDADVVGDE